MGPFILCINQIHCMKQLKFYYKIFTVSYDSRFDQLKQIPLRGCSSPEQVFSKGWEWNMYGVAFCRPGVAAAKIVVLVLCK